MKICPKCNKSNPDNSKKCFFCNENLSEILPFVPKNEETISQEPKENIFEPKNREEEKDFEAIDQPEDKLKKINLSLPEKKKNKLKKIYTPSDYVNILFPLFSIIIFAITVFICILIIISYNMKENIITGIIFASFTFIGGSLFSIGIMWLNAIIHILKSKENHKI